LECPAGRAGAAGYIAPTAKARADSAASSGQMARQRRRTLFVQVAALGARQARG